MQNKLQTLKWAAEMLNVSTARATAMAREGILPPGVAVRLGRQWRIHPERLAAFIDSGGQALAGGWKREAQ